MINEMYAGKFSEDDRVLLSNLYDTLSGDSKLAAKAAQSDEQIFMESIFPKVFSSTALDSYKRHQSTYRTLFEDREKYDAYMSVLAHAIFAANNSGQPDVFAREYTYPTPEQALSMVAEPQAEYGTK